MKKLAILLAVSTLALGGCSWSWPWNWGSSSPSASGSASKESVAAIIAEAEVIWKKGGVTTEWRDTEKMIKDAKADLEKGELDKAMKTAKEAKFQAELGVQQIADQQNVKPWLF